MNEIEKMILSDAIKATIKAEYRILKLRRIIGVMGVIIALLIVLLFVT